MVVKLSPIRKKEMLDIVERYGYQNEKEFIEDALRRRILELKKTEFLEKAGAIRKKITKRGISEKDILKDFDEFYHQK